MIIVIETRNFIYGVVARLPSTYHGTKTSLPQSLCHLLMTIQL